MDVGGPAAVGLAEAAGEHVDDGFREVDGAGFYFCDVGCLDAAGDEEHAHVADDFGGGGDFDDVAEELVDFGVGAGDFAPAVAEAHGVGLFAEVGVLAAGHFVFVNFSGAGAGGGVERFVEGEDVFPVVGMSLRASRSRPGSCSEEARAAQTELRFGWEVEPDMEAMARSAMSTPARDAAMTEAALRPEVSWVWKWMGIPISCFRA